MSRHPFNKNARHLYTAQKNLHEFAQSQDIETPAMLLQNGAEVYAEDDSGATALHLAAQAANINLIGLMCRYDRSGINSSGPLGTALGIAAAANDIETLRALVDAGADINAPDHNSETPLMRALNAGAENTLRLLMQMGADSAAAHVDNRTILHMAAEANNTKALHIILENGGLAHLNIRMTGGAQSTPLHSAVKSGAEDALRLLMSHGADVNKADAEKMTPLHSAAVRGDAGMIYTLVTEGHAEMHRLRTDEGYTPLHSAVLFKNESAMRALCDLGADAHAKDNAERTALNMAGWNGFLPAVKYLMEEIPAETDADDAMQSRLHALYDALFYEHDDTAGYLIASGKIDVNLPTRSGEYALNAALQNSNAVHAESLLAAGATADIKNAGGISPLVLCAGRNLLTAASLLLKSGANPNFLPVSEPPLHTAIASDNTPMVTLLLEHGANPLLTDGFGRMALDVARQKGRGDMIGAIEIAQQRFDNMAKQTPSAAAPRPPGA